MASDKAVNGKTLKFLLLLAGALAGNLLHINLFFDTLIFSFGGIFLYTALELLGFLYAIPVALLLSAELTLIHSSPFEALFLLVEFLLVALLRNKFKVNLVLADWLFWAFLGIPAYFLFLVLFVGYDSIIALTLPLNDSVNGIMNVAFASLITILYRLKSKTEGAVVSYREILSVTFLIAMTVPMIAWAIYDSKKEEKETVEETKRELEEVTRIVSNYLTLWLNLHLNAVSELANRLAIWGPENREQLQKETQLIRRTFKNLHACYIADEDATTIAFYPEVNPKGRYMIGINFSYRPYYKKVKKTKRPVFTKVFIAKFALKPVVGIAVPALKDGKFIGYAYCGLQLEHLKEVIESFLAMEGVFLTLIDSEGKVIASSLKRFKALGEFKAGNVERSKYGIDLVYRGSKSYASNLDKYLNSFFRTERSLDPSIGWKVEAEVPIKHFMANFFRDITGSFATIFFLAGVSFVVSRLLGKMMSEPLENLASTVDLMTKTVETGQKVKPSSTNILEISIISRAFEELARKVLNYMEELKKLAYYDPLTQLPNRILLRDRLEKAIAIAKRNGTKVAVMFIDLDYFKTVNDTLGHEIGDRILVQVANRLSSVFRETDTVARFGGDEFVAVLNDIKDVNDIITVAEKILKLFETHFDIGGEEIFLSASIGIALYPDNGEDPTTLIKNADMAMYKAKEEGKRNFAFFSEEMNRKAIELLSLKNRLHKALERGEFTLYYQPVYKVSTGELVGFEALLRWIDPKEGIVPPSKFMPILEELGLIKEVGNWVMEKAFEKSKEWEEFNIYICVNVSPRQFADKRFTEKVSEILKKTGANAFNLTLEITETSLMSNPEESIRTLKKLKALGFRLALDDFGTGYSSLAYLKRLPIDIIKVDMTFTKSAPQSDVDKAIISSIVTLSKSLGIDSLAEGVESSLHLETIRSLGCDLAQGFYLGKPMPEEEARAFLVREKGL